MVYLVVYNNNGLIIQILVNWFRNNSFYFTLYLRCFSDYLAHLKILFSGAFARHVVICFTILLVELFFLTDMISLSSAALPKVLFP